MLWPCAFAALYMAKMQFTGKGGHCRLKNRLAEIGRDSTLFERQFPYLLQCKKAPDSKIEGIRVV
jgi:hypothetical protein